MENPISLIIACFRDQKEAAEVLEELKLLKKEKTIDLWNAAVITKNQNGKLSLKEIAQTVGIKSDAGICGILGAIIGIVAGGPIAGIVLDTAPRAFSGKVINLGFDNRELREIGDSMVPGSSAIVAIIENKWVEELVYTLTKVGTEIIRQQPKNTVADAIAFDGCFEDTNKISTKVAL
ncbi:hypothetical protein CEN39_07510 [Fischerella thermalis CCMEE 5201]|jgi:uncharacterized membrane protein|nr:hypothetical protein CEN39_07510 [Fischerella thermalis CCMEE 5201]